MAGAFSDQPPANRHAVAIALGIGGAIVGAATGVLVSILLSRIGLYPIAAIGALTGLVCAFGSQRRSLILGFVSLAITAVVTIFNEWWYHPFLKDPSLGFFLRNLSQVHFYFWISLIVGGGLAFWFGLGNERSGPEKGR